MRLHSSKTSSKTLHRNVPPFCWKTATRQIFSIRSTTVLTVRTPAMCTVRKPLLPSGGDRASFMKQSNLNECSKKKTSARYSYSFFQGDELTSYRQAVEKCKNFCTNFKTSYQNLFVLWYSRYGQDIPDQLHCKGMYRAGLFCTLFQRSIPFRLTRQEHV